MTKIGFITSPLSTGHAIRGVGFYTKYLLEHLHLLAAEFGFEIVEVSDHEPRTTNYELVHYPFFDLFFHTLPIFNRFPMVVTVHDVIPLEFPAIYRVGLRSGLNLKLQKLALSRASRVITDSLASKANITRLLSVPDAKVVPIYLAAGPGFHPITNFQLLSEAKAKYHLPEKFVLYVGDINWNKNLSTLVSACLDSKLPLVLVGKHITQIENSNFSHPELAHLHQLAGLLNHPTILRLGFVPDSDMSALYSLATVYCQPSYAEGFGLPVLEAMSCGTPVVCSRSHSLPEIGGSAPLYFDPFHSRDLSDKLVSLWDSPDLRKSMSNKGSLQVTKFSWDKTARETLNVYLDVLR